MQFVDYTEVFIRSGKGGRGMVSFRSGSHCPKAGADGGDGGFGGSVYLVGNRGINTLSHLRYRQRFAAEDGEKGGTNSCTGRNGKDLEIQVPLGTLARRVEDDALVGEVLEHAQRVLVAKGGKRGLGNQRFLSSTHQAPEESTPGGPADEFWAKLELKLLADVGFAGFPNAGKSTLLSVISAAKPKIADYPFTTLTPQLGVVDVDPHDYLQPKSFVAADIPGLIEGASEGRGLGHEFLRHLERTKVIAFVVDAFTQDIDAVQQLLCLRRELAQYSPMLAAKPAIVVLTKMDLAPHDFNREEAVLFAAEQNLKCFLISSATHQGLQELKHGLFELIQTPETPEASAPSPLDEYRLITS